MSRLAVFLILFGLHFSFAQKREYKLVIKDAETLEPVEDVIVTVLRTKQNFITNSEGRVSFSFTGVSNIKIEHTTYHTQNIRSNSLKNKENVILLKNMVNVLDEVIITFQNPYKKLKKLVNNSREKLTAPCRLKVYSREFYKQNGKYSSYNDGLLNFIVFGKNERFRNDILIEQNRSVGLVDSDIYKDLLGYNLNDIMENYYNFDYIKHLLEKDAVDKYDFKMKPYAKNDKYYLITVSPKKTQKNFKDHYSIIYDEKLDIIIEINSEQETPMDKSIDHRIVGEKKIYKSNFKNIYKYHNEMEYYMLSSKEELGFTVLDKKRKLQEIEVRNYLFTNTFYRNRLTYAEKDIFKHKTLLAKSNKVLTDYWNYSGLEPLHEEVLIIKSIE